MLLRFSYANGRKYANLEGGGVNKFSCMDVWVLSTGSFGVKE